jgi:hypothetical protein
MPGFLVSRCFVAEIGYGMEWIGILLALYAVPRDEIGWKWGVGTISYILYRRHDRLKDSHSTLYLLFNCWWRINGSGFL